MAIILNKKITTEGEKTTKSLQTEGEWIRSALDLLGNLLQNVPETPNKKDFAKNFMRDFRAGAGIEE